MKRMGKDMSDREILEMMKELGIPDNGQIDYSQF